MKKEADFILLEVRRKIYEAKRTIEKIKVFEKLRQARQSNSVKKGKVSLSIFMICAVRFFYKAAKGNI